MKRKNQIEKIGDVINSFYKNYNLLKKETNQSLMGIWESIIGPHISASTQNVVLKKNIIYIYIQNPIIRKPCGAKKRYGTFFRRPLHQLWRKFSSFERFGCFCRKNLSFFTVFW